MKSQRPFHFEDRPVKVPEGLERRYQLPEDTMTGYFYSPRGDRLSFTACIPENAWHTAIVEIGTSQIAEDWAILMHANAKAGIATIVPERFNHGCSAKSFPDTPERLGARPFPEMSENLFHAITELANPLIAEYAAPDSRKTLIMASQGCAVGAPCLQKYPGIVDQAMFFVPMIAQHELMAKHRWGMIADRRMNSKLRSLYGEEPTPDMVYPTEYEERCDERMSNMGDYNPAIRYRDRDLNPGLDCYRITKEWIDHGADGCKIVQDPAVPRGIEIPSLVLTAYSDRHAKKGGDECVVNSEAYKFSSELPNSGHIEIDAEHDLFSEHDGVLGFVKDTIHQFAEDAQSVIDDNPSPTMGRFFSRAVNLDRVSIPPPTATSSPSRETATPAPSGFGSQVLEPSSA